MWWRLTLGVLALAILGGGRRRLTLALAVPLAVAVFSSVGRLFVEIPEPRDIEQFASWLSHVIVDQWPTFLGMLAAALGATWAVVFVAAGLPPAARARMLATTVALAGALCVAQVLARPGDPGQFGIYEGSWHEGQLDALGLPTFLAATAVVLSLGTLVAGSRRHVCRSCTPGPG
jgi:hypothetical protein